LKRRRQSCRGRVAPSMTSAMKNWEAQARTNSILAGSLKALEERVEDMSDLLEWCARHPKLTTPSSFYMA
jgi:predicted membrane chloride channel (bestrophin family)